MAHASGGDPKNGGAETTLRAFLAIEPAASIRAALVALKRELAARRFPVRWVRDEGLHATLKFLGEISPEVLARARQSLAQVVPPVGRFPARVAGLGAFPSQRRPRIIWVGLRGEALGELFRRVETALAPLGLGTEARPSSAPTRASSAHITLGRVKRRPSKSQLSEIFDANRIVDFGISVVHELLAYRSDLRKDGAVYTKLWTIPFTEHTGGTSHDS